MEKQKEGPIKGLRKNKPDDPQQLKGGKENMKKTKIKEGPMDF